MSSLPVPLSPWIRTVAVVGAILSTMVRMLRIGRALADDLHRLVVLVDEGLEGFVFFLKQALLFENALVRASELEGLFLDRLLELLVEALGFVVKASVGDRDGDLRGDGFERDHVVFVKRVLLVALDIEGGDDFASSLMTGTQSSDLVSIGSERLV